MYLSCEQIKESLPHLRAINPFFGMSFLAFKECGIPIGKPQPVNFTKIVNTVLERHYRVTPAYQGFYNPFLTARKANRWVKPRYGSTALQRITTDTFGDAFDHLKNTPEWGWRSDYIQRLANHLKRHRIPAFHLSVWLFRNHEWPTSVNPGDIMTMLFKTYSIREHEMRLFDVALPESLAENWMSAEPVSETELLDVIGRPPSFAPEEGAALKQLDLNNIGPAAPFHYEPSDRLNVITGDNSLGKTFLLDSVWWALTGNWLGCPAIPRSDIAKKDAVIRFELAAEGGRTKQFSVPYIWERQTWQARSRREILCGLVVYARYDGAFAIWDPARFQSADKDDDSSGRIHLTKDALWDGLRDSATGKWLCNGLIRDWVSWQSGGERYADQYRSFGACMRGLSPSSDEPLAIAKPTRIPNDSRDIPTLSFRYGDVPILTASAGVQRIVALAYVLVWAWYEHLAISALSRRDPQRRLVLILDEVEAHLHPRWQRAIIPSLIQTIKVLADSLHPQLHLATHSPMVMASVESVFDEEHDALFHLKCAGAGVLLEDIPFVRRGTADQWLISQVFGLKQPRSALAEAAIAKATSLQTAHRPDPEQVREAHQALLQTLADNDAFWPRWLFFAEKHGIGTRQ